MSTGKYLEWYFQGIASLYGDIKFLVRNNPPKTHKIIPRLLVIFNISFFSCEEWIYDSTVSLVVFCDSVTGSSRICYKYIWSLCCLFIPSSHNGKRRWDNQLGKPIEPTKFQKSTVSLSMAPEISCWCMAISDMFCFSLRTYTLGFR